MKTSTIYADFTESRWCNHKSFRKAASANINSFSKTTEKYKKKYVKIFHPGAFRYTFIYVDTRSYQKLCCDST